MDHIDPDPASELTRAVQISWRRFLEVYEPLRPDLYRYCRYLTRSPWDAEDLVQDTNARAFVTLGQLDDAPANPRAWLFRVASNLWIDHVRRERLRAPPEAGDGSAAPPRQDAREAAGTLLALLSPQERAAVVLKDVFDFTLEETAEALSTSIGAIKAALHRGRARLADDAPADTEVARPETLDAFCAALNAQDLEALTALLLDNAVVQVVGATTQYGQKAARERVLPGMLYGSERMARADALGGMDPRYIQGVLAKPPRGEVRGHRGEWLLLLWYAHADGEAVRAINRLEIDGDRVVVLRNYFYAPDVLLEICRELDVPFRSNGYRFCQPGT